MLACSLNLGSICSKFCLKRQHKALFANFAAKQTLPYPATYSPICRPRSRIRCRLSSEVERQTVENRQLSTSLTAAKAKSVELELRLQAALKSREMDVSAAAAREAMLHAEVEQARARADTMSQTLAEASANCDSSSNS